MRAVCVECTQSKREAYQVPGPVKRSVGFRYHCALPRRFKQKVGPRLNASRQAAFFEGREAGSPFASRTISLGDASLPLISDRSWAMRWGKGSSWNATMVPRRSNCFFASSNLPRRRSNSPRRNSCVRHFSSFSGDEARCFSSHSRLFSSRARFISASFLSSACHDASR